MSGEVGEGEWRRATENALDISSGIEEIDEEEDEDDSSLHTPQQQILSLFAAPYNPNVIPSEPSTSADFVPKGLKRRYRFRTTEYMMCRAVQLSGGEGVTPRELAENVVYLPGHCNKPAMKAVNRDIARIQGHNPDIWIRRVCQMGKITVNKIIWKGNEKEVEGVMKEFMQLSGLNFKLGEKIPTSGKSKLTISERNVTRMNIILRNTIDELVIPFPRSVFRKLLDESQTDGTLVDWRSINKFLDVLEGKGCVRLYNTVVNEAGIERNVELCCSPGIDFMSDIVQDKLRSVRSGLIAESEMKSRMDKSPPKRDQPESAKRRKKGVNNQTEIGNAILDSSASSSADDSTAVDCSLLISEVLKTDVPNETTETDFNLSGLNSGEPNSDQPGPSSLADVDPAAEESKEKTSAINAIASYDPSAQVRYGCQSRARLIRMSVLHEVIWYLTRGYQGEGPSFEHLFPPVYAGAKSAPSKTPLVFHACKPREGENTEPHVYMDEFSWRRFIPPLPRYQELTEGWFLVDDLLLLFPLSIFLLIIPVSYDIKGLEEYLQHPEKRHLLVADLPKDIRKALWYNNRHVTPITDLILSLWIMGLLSCGPSKLSGNDQNFRYDYYYAHKGIEVLDTSTSGRRYLTVEPPLQKYPSYTYHFQTHIDIWTFWLHLRALGFSTKLGNPSMKCEDDEPYMSTEHKKVGKLCRSRRHALGEMGLSRVGFEDVVSIGYPNHNRNGVAGFSPLLFLHRGTNWCINTAANAKWFVDWMRKACSDLEDIVRDRVESINEDWNSVVRGAFAAKDLPWYNPGKAAVKMHLAESLVQSNRKAAQASKLGKKMFGSTLHAASNPPRPSLPSTPNQSGGSKGAKKRKLDQTDLESLQRSTTCRSVFSSREKEMLLFLKALNYFLYPHHRIWVNLATIRDLMHEYVPVSRNKTTQSLMAVLNREMLRKKAKAIQMQRIVSRLERIPRLVELREANKTQLAIMNSEDASDFFRTAFQMANEELVKNSELSPAFDWGEDRIKDFMDGDNYETFEDSAFETSIDEDPIDDADSMEGEGEAEEGGSGDLTSSAWKHKDPTTLQQVQAATVHNLVLANFGLVKSDGSFGKEIYHIFQEFPEIETAKVIAQLRTYGFIAVIRSEKRNRSSVRHVDDGVAAGRPKHDYCLSTLVRQYFYHRFHVHLTSTPAWDLLRELKLGRTANLVVEGDAVTPWNSGAIGVVASLFTQNKICFDLQVPSNVVVLDGAQEAPPPLDLSERWGDDGSELGFLMKEMSETERALRLEKLSHSKSGLVLMRQKQLNSVMKADRRTLNIRDSNRTHLKPCELRCRLLPSDTVSDIQPEEMGGVAEKMLDTVVIPTTILDFAKFVTTQPEENREFLKELYYSIEGTQSIGIPGDKLKKTYAEGMEFGRAMKCLLDAKQVFEVGVKSCRFVALPHAKWWYASSFAHGNSMKREDEPVPILYLPRPWTKPEGSINRRILRWMTEGVLLLILNGPGIREKELWEHFSPFLQPKVTEELIRFLSAINCVKRIKQFERKKIFVGGAFDPPKVELNEMWAFEPTPESLVHFATEFQSEELPFFACGP